MLEKENARLTEELAEAIRAHAELVDSNQQKTHTIVRLTTLIAELQLEKGDLSERMGAEVLINGQQALLLQARDEELGDLHDQLKQAREEISRLNTAMVDIAGLTEKVVAFVARQ